MIRVTVALTLFLALTCSKVVIELDGNSIESSMKAHPMGFIKFYSPSCPHCQTIEPVFEQSAQEVKTKGLEVAFMRINGDEHPEIMNKFEVSDVPTILWFNNMRNQLVAYNGDTEMSSYFMTFIEQQLKFETPEITFNQWKDLTSGENFTGTKNVLILVGDVEKNKNDFFKITNSAWNAEIKSIYVSNDSEFLTYYNLEKSKDTPFGLLMFKVRNGRVSIDRFESIKLTNKDLDKGEFKESTLLVKLESLMRLYSKELVSIFDADHEKLILMAIPTFVFVHNYEFGTPQYDEMVSTLTGVALLYRREMFFMYGSANTKFTQIFAESYRLNSKDMPVMCIASPGESEMLEKYRRVLNIKDRAPTAEEIIMFIEDWKIFNLTPYTSSEEVPTNPTDENGIMKLVGDTFRKTVETRGKDVVVLVCSDRLEACNKFRPIFTRVAKKLKSNDKLMLAEVNPYTNEIEFVGYDLMPSVIVFQDKENKMENFKEYKGKLFTRDIIKFIKENVVNAITKEETLPHEDVTSKEEIQHEVKTMDLEQKGVARKLYETLTDPEQKVLFKSPDAEVIKRERDFLIRKIDMTLQKVIKMQGSDREDL
jgi:thioredoxin-like negative regulator of GroEL